jgi:hypothetical protein
VKSRATALMIAGMSVAAPNAFRMLRFVTVSSSGVPDPIRVGKPLAVP